MYIKFTASPLGQQLACTKHTIHVRIWLLTEKQVKIPVILIKTINNPLWLKNMIGLVQRINKISHSKGNFAHRQFSVLAHEPLASVCLLWWWIGGGVPGIFWSYQQQQGHGASIMTWPPLPPACTWTGTTSGCNFLFSFVDHLTMCFPQLRRMSSHSSSTSGLCTPASCAPMLRQLTMVCRQHSAHCLRNKHISYRSREMLIKLWSKEYKEVSFYGIDIRIGRSNVSVSYWPFWPCL